MPADRRPRAGPSTPRPNTNPAGEKHKPQPLEQRNGDGIPGISKLKASIRQTKRFLAKEGLEPGLKVQTQRRLESLEADLAKAERRGVEMKNGSKYHMIKFFERQKLLRIIKKQQRKVDKAESSSGGVQAAERELEQARIMLNYVLNFPNTEKYISLFAPSESKSESQPGLPSYLSPTYQPDESDKPGKRRIDILNEMKRLMEAGKLSQTPEDGLGTGEKVKVDLELPSGEGKRKRLKQEGAGDVQPAEDEVEKGKAVTSEEGDEAKKAKKEKKDKKEKKKAKKEVEGIKKDTEGGGDDFFE